MRDGDIRLSSSLEGRWHPDLHRREAQSSSSESAESQLYDSVTLSPSHHEVENLI